MSSFTLKAFAKINTHLKIVGRRKDGYHLLQTIFSEISLHDTLRFSPAPKGIHLTVSPRTVPSGTDNLVVKALSLLQKKMGAEKGIRVRLIKKTPMGAGLGGGSSDAAAALWGGYLMWKKRPISQYRKKVPPLLLSCAKQLGADVSFFLKGGRASATGVGDKLTSLRLPSKQWLVVVYPRLAVSTPLAYKLFDQAKLHQNKVKPFNSFEPVVFKHFPEVGRVHETLSDWGCQGVMMSGSGSAVFGFVRNEKAALKVKRALSTERWDVHVAHVPPPKAF